MTGTSLPASSSSWDLTAACSRSAASLAEYTSDRAWKKVSCAVLNLFQSASSSARAARPASFQERISSRKAAAVAAQSVEDASASASVTSSSLRARAVSRSPSSSAKYALRRLLKALRAADSRFHRAASTARSARGAAFHSSSSWRSRSPLIFQWVASAASRSASATIRSLMSLASARAWSRAARTSSWRWSTFPDSASSLAWSWPRSPTAWASVTAPRSRSMVARAWAGDRSVVVTRCSSRVISVFSASNLRR